MLAAAPLRVIPLTVTVLPVPTFASANVAVPAHVTSSPLTAAGSEQFTVAAGVHDLDVSDDGRRLYLGAVDPSSTLGALAHGVPLVVLPLFSLDQWFNAAAVTLSGNDAKVADDNSKAVAAKMTQEQILAAKQIGQKCLSGDYKACD